VLSTRALLFLSTVFVAVAASATVTAQVVVPVDVQPDNRDHEMPPPDADLAQAQVNQARKLLKLQKPAEAIPLLEQAYLILEDPEVLRMLGEANADLGETDKALRYFDTYLADPLVGESAKEPIRARRAPLTGAGKASDPDGDPEDDESIAEAVGVSGWSSGGAGLGVPGHLFLMAGAHFLHNPGGSFAVARGGTGVGAEAIQRGDWVHGGLGVVVGVGGYLLDDLSLGVQLGNDWMNWEGRAATLPFETTIYDGLRPEIALDLRYLIGLGVSVGALVGGDAIILSDGGRADPNCQVGIDCPDFEVESGVQGYRVFFGGVFGYRSELTKELSLGLDLDARYAPVFVGSKDLVDTLPGYTDPSWLLRVGVGMWWNL